MNTLNLEALAAAVTFDADNMWVELTDGRQLGVPLVYFPRLAKASTDSLTLKIRRRGHDAN